MELLLVSGTGGSGVSSVAAGLARGLRERGLATAELSSAVAAPVVGSQVWAEATQTFGVWLRSLGTASLGPEELLGLAGLNELLTGVMAAEATGDPSIDAVIWDMGSLREAGRTLQLLDSVPVLLDRLLTGSVADALSAPNPAEMVAAWYRLVTHLAQAREVLTRSRAVLVGGDQDGDRLQAGLGMLRLFDSTPTAVVINRAATPKSALRDADSLGLPAFAVGSRQGRLKTGWLARQLTGLVELVEQLPPVSAPAWTVSARDGGFRLTFPLRAGAQVRVGRRGDALLLVCDGHQRHFELPPVLKRCLIQGGGMRGSELLLGFSPDPRVWREEA